MSSVRDGLPLPVRHLAEAASRMDRSHLLGAGVAVLGTFLAAAAIRNKQLSHALRDKDRDMAQLVTKVRDHSLLAAPASTHEPEPGLLGRVALRGAAVYRVSASFQGLPGLQVKQPGVAGV